MVLQNTSEIVKEDSAQARLFRTRLLKANLSQYVIFCLTPATDNLLRLNLNAVKLHLINLLALSGILGTHLSMYFTLKFVNSLCKSSWFRLLDILGHGPGINDSPLSKRDRVWGVSLCLAKLITCFVKGWVA